MNPDATTWNARLQGLSPRAFEHAVAALWEARGWRCGVSSPGADGGVDVVARRSGIVGLTAAVQAKQYAPDRSIGVGTVREYAGLYRGDDPPDTVCLVASCGFTATARSEARERDVQLVDGRDLAAYCEAIEGRIASPLEALLAYLDDSPRAASPRLPAIRMGPAPIPGATAVDGAADRAKPSARSGSAVGELLRRADLRGMAARGAGLVVRVVPSLRSPDWRPTVLRWSPPGTIQCRNASPQARRNLRSVAARHPRARCSAADGTLTLRVAGDPDGGPGQLPRVILAGCLGVTGRELCSVVRHGEDGGSVIYAAGTGEGS